MPHVVRVRVQRASNLTSSDGRRVRASVVIKHLNKKRAQTQVYSLSNNPTWNQIFNITVDSVARLDFIVKNGLKTLGTAFVDLTALQQATETNFICQISNGGELYITITAIDFDPPQTREFGYIGMTYPLVFAQPKTFSFGRKSHFIWDEDLRTDVFRIHKSGFFSSNHWFILSDLSDTPLLFTKGRIGSRYYKTYLGHEKGPNVSAVRTKSVYGANQAIRMTGGDSFQVVGRGSKRREFDFVHKNAGTVAQVTKKPKKMYSVTIQPGFDVLLILMSCLIADREIQGQESEEAALLTLGVASSCLLMLVVVAPVL